MKPYVGVTGITTPAEAQAVVAAWFEAWGDAEPTHDLMLGVLVSRKTLHGGTNKYPRRYPKRGDIAACFVRSPGVLNLLHYASDTPPSAEDIALLREVAGDACDGFQFNGAWPALRDLDVFSCDTNEPRIVLQVATRMLAVTPDGFAASLAPYRGHNATDLLLDPSMGRGVRATPAQRAALVPFMDVLASRWPGPWNLGVAGGLDATAFDEPFADGPEGVLAWADVLRQTSIDAEGRLRDDADGGGNLDLAKVAAYLEAAVGLLRTETT